ncbi:hypothetical protein ACFE04_028635 [Oxalis oulophora]
MAIRFPQVMHAKNILRKSNLFTSSNVPKGCLAVYVGETEKKRFVIPISFLNEPAFQELLCKAEEEFGFQHPMGGLTIIAARGTEPLCSNEFVDSLFTFAELYCRGYKLVGAGGGGFALLLANNAECANELRLKLEKDSSFDVKVYDWRTI